LAAARRILPLDVFGTSSGLDQDDIVMVASYNASHHRAGARFSDSHSAGSACVSARVTIRSVAGSRISHAKCGHRALNQTRNVSEGLFQLLG